MDINLDDTARIDRRQAIFAQIEAALLADKLSLQQTPAQGPGSDPYNSGVYKGMKGVAETGAWTSKRHR